jgi:GAF domain-containing protein
MNNDNTRRGGNAAPPRVLSGSELQEQVTELAAQRAAISEVLRAIASSPHDLQPIFETILDSTRRLCRAELGVFRLVEEAGLRLVALSPAVLEGYSPPMLLEHGSFVGRLIASKSPVHIPDLAAHEVYRAGDPAAVALIKWGLRTLLFVPMLRNDELIGVLAIGWQRLAGC